MSANGFLSDDELAYIDNGQRLVPSAATRYLALREAAHAAGHPFSALEGYRSYATQQYLWSLYGSPRASYPGLSPHGWGLAVDIMNDADPQGIIRFKDPLYNWLDDNAGEYGFNNRVGISINEPWHWVYDGTGAAGFDATPFPNSAGVILRYLEENNMSDIRVIAHKRDDGQIEEVAACAPWIRHPERPEQIGYITAKWNTPEAAGFCRVFGGVDPATGKSNGSAHAVLNRNDYLGGIAAAKMAAAAYQAGAK